MRGRKLKKRIGYERGRFSRCTPFQRRVYRIVSGIPFGETRSYKWVALRLGNPRAARSVGQALKRNPDPLRVPCHRVVMSDGSPGGYRWGAAKKKKLLEEERKRAGKPLFLRRNKWET